jgi:hypothetical protein
VNGFPISFTRHHAALTRRSRTKRRHAQPEAHNNTLQYSSHRDLQKLMPIPSFPSPPRPARRSHRAPNREIQRWPQPLLFKGPPPPTASPPTSHLGSSPGSTENGQPALSGSTGDKPKGISPNATGDRTTILNPTGRTRKTRSTIYKMSVSTFSPPSSNVAGFESEESSEMKKTLNGGNCS